MGLLQAALFFVVIALLPYMLRRAWKRAAVCPQYKSYLRSCAGLRRDNGGRECCGPEERRGDGGTTSSVLLEPLMPLAAPHADDTTPSNPTGPDADPDANAASSAGLCELLQPNNRRSCSKGGHKRDSLSAAGGGGVAKADSSFARGGAGVLYSSAGRRTHIFSLKMPRVELGSASSFAEVAARVTAAAASALATYNTTAATTVLPAEPLQGTTGGSRRTIQLESMACVEGCMHVLMVVSMSAGPDGGRRRAMFEHRDVQLVDATGAVDTAGLEVAVREMIGDIANAMNVNDDNPELDGGTAYGPEPLLWPPALPQSAAEGEGGGCAVAVALPCQSLEGLSAVRCIVVGPLGEGHTVHLDEEVLLRRSGELDEGASSGLQMESHVEGYLIVRCGCVPVRYHGARKYMFVKLTHLFV